ncbi:zinc-ribbon domain-containing protein [Ruegeria arenilitoris]|uniref:zinc-ribbon domain-containing protein n=1 Tax=Ruegeria arenilitoris TaxID=1173585 RepID=UPI00147B8B72|nr:zinc-ribbon domain-containing protein [Ruegeria arenilitoris]
MKRQLELFPKLPSDKQLLSDFPELAAEFHRTENGSKTPEDFTKGTSKKVWWRCQNGHEWSAPISNRTRLGNGCPYCSGKLATAENNLEVANPSLCKEWNNEKNKKKPRDYTPRSSAKVWWRCEKGHDWQAPISNRNSSQNTILRGCPYCTNRKVCGDNNFAFLHPEMAREWHPENKEQPEKVLATSNKKVRWKCSEGHTWRESPSNRAMRVYGCPECSKEIRGDSYRKATEHQNLQTENPTVCKEWHHDKNEKPPSFYVSGSNDVVWWRCQNGHEWQAAIYSRTNPNDGVGTGCSFCSGRRASAERNLATNHPDVAAEWHPTKNKLNPTDVTPKSNKVVWWRCENGHEWKTDIATRTMQGTVCPKCSNRIQYSKNEIRILTELHALVGDVEWRHKIDGVEVDVYLPSLSVAIEYDGDYWHRDKEEKDKKKQTIIQARGIKLFRVREAPLPALSDEDIIVPGGSLLSKETMNELVLRVGLEKIAEDRYLSHSDFLNDDLYRKYLDLFPSPLPEKSLASLNPTLAAEWHPKRNRPLTPSNFTARSGHKVWWQCDKGHEWEASIGMRDYYNAKCPCCSGRKATPENCMAVTRPDMAAVWHPKRNGEATPENTKAGSGIKRWWLCSQNPDHEWQQTPDKLQHHLPDNFCPHCREERNPPLASTHPEIARMWHPTKNGKVTPDDVKSGSSTYRWWVCPENQRHEWENSPSNLANPNRKLGYCPFCTGRRVFKG